MAHKVWNAIFRAVIFLPVLSGAHLGMAQAGTASDKLPSFEVATVKPLGKEGMHSMGVRVEPGGRVLVQGFPLRTLVMVAFDLNFWRVSGGDTGDDVPRYDIEAKAPEVDTAHAYDTRYTLFRIRDPRLRQMLQALLIDRFHLVFHRHAETGRVYLLERTDKPFAMKPVEGVNAEYPSNSVQMLGDHAWHIYDTTMPELANFLDGFVLRQPVIDKTGVSGVFSFDSKMTLSPEEARGPEMMQTLLPVLREMGLRLVPSSGPVEKLVIDHEEPPTEN